MKKTPLDEHDIKDLKRQVSDFLLTATQRDENYPLKDSQLRKLLSRVLQLGRDNKVHPSKLLPVSPMDKPVLEKLRLGQLLSGAEDYGEFLAVQEFISVVLPIIEAGNEIPITVLGMT